MYYEDRAIRKDQAQKGSEIYTWQLSRPPDGKVFRIPRRLEQQARSFSCLLS